MPNDHGIRGEVVLAHTDTHLEARVHIPADSDLFDGHFPAYRLLPAVGQFAILNRLAHTYFATGPLVPAIRRMKFSAPIVPDATIRVSLTLKPQSGAMAFEIADAAEPARVYSSGSFSVTGGGADAGGAGVPAAAGACAGGMPAACACAAGTSAERGGTAAADAAAGAGA